MWEAIDDLCAIEGLTRDRLCELIEGSHNGQNRSSAIRAFVVTYFHALSTKVNEHGQRAPALLEACETCDRLVPSQSFPADHLEITLRTFRGT